MLCLTDTSLYIYVCVKHFGLANIKIANCDNVVFSLCLGTMRHWVIQIWKQWNCIAFLCRVWTIRMWLTGVKLACCLQTDVTKQTAPDVAFGCSEMPSIGLILSNEWAESRSSSVWKVCLRFQNPNRSRQSQKLYHSPFTISDRERRVGLVEECFSWWHNLEVLKMSGRTVISWIQRILLASEQRRRINFGFICFKIVTWSRLMAVICNWVTWFN